MSVVDGMLTEVGVHYFIDETKAKGYVVVAVGCPDACLAVARRTVGKLVLPGQRSIHMKRESARRRRQIVAAVVDLHDVGVIAMAVDAGRGPEPEYVRRDRALRAIVELAASQDAVSLVLDLDPTLVTRDSRTIADACRIAGARTVTYSHQPLSHQPLLTLPDVVAWCWARGGDWRRRILPIVGETLRA